MVFFRQTCNINYFILFLNLFSVILIFFFRKTIILKGYRRGPTFSKEAGDVQLFPGEVGGQMLISIETFLNL